MGVESLGVRLHPLTEATGVESRADRGEGLAWIAHHFPQMLQPFAKPIDSGQIHQAQKITLVWPVQDMEGVGDVGQQPAVLVLRPTRVWGTMYGPRCGNRIKPRRLRNSILDRQALATVALEIQPASWEISSSSIN